MKNTKSIFAVFMALSALFSVSSCKKDKLKGKGTVKLTFDSRAGNANFAYGTEYTNAAGEKLTFTKLQYYVSNFVLIKEDGSEYVVPQELTYRLIDEGVAGSEVITLPDIPAGEYTKVKFIVGVDSLRSTMDVSKRTGDLDPAGKAADMYWSWNSGYIFFKIEGTSPASTRTGNVFMYHIGGYGGYSTPTANNIRTITLTSPNAIEIGEGRAPEVHIYADILESLKTPTTISIANTAVVHMPMAATTFANNYADMFKIDHVHNE
ncbi:MAG: hypothetical protein NZM35_00295 [Chitinophagales bacterium]|nr:hypothetical protein [Chitinophagales bacterium]MDW8417884.1 hypothetical protein [Chitinophagales bacterium]